VDQYLTQDNLIVVALVFGVLMVGIVLLRRKGKRAKPVEILDPHERLRHALGKTRGGLLDAIRKTVSGKLDDAVISALEEIMLRTDIGGNTTDKLLEGLRQGYKAGKIDNQAGVVEFLKTQLKEKLGGEHPKLIKADSPPTVILVAGVNGSGKTTSIAKLTHHLASEGNKVLLCASDTFRAAAVEQLKTWAERLGVEIVLGQQGHDPAAVAHVAHEKAVAKGFDYLIIDTAGRLHTDKNLMKELEKIARVGKKHIADSPHEVLLVLDATTGQNAVRQAEAFTKAINVTGIILSKLDGTAKGGIVVVIKEELGIPVKFVGLGEQHTDLAPFDAEVFVDALFT
jgi:fused signal recognition particle receptor